MNWKVTSTLILFFVALISPPSSSCQGQEYDMCESATSNKPPVVDPSDYEAASRVLTELLYLNDLSPSLIVLQPSSVRGTAYSCPEKETVEVRKGDKVESERRFTGRIYILFNFDGFKSNTRQNAWKLRSILAHEVGHLTGLHFLPQNTLSTYEKERRADVFAGKTLAEQGARCPDALAGFLEWATGPETSNSDSYPTIKERRAAFLSGCESVKSPMDEFQRGVEAYNKGNLDKSIKHFSEALKVNSNHKESYFGRANAYYDKKEYDLAISDYTKDIELDPHYALAHLYRGGTYRKMALKAKEPAQRTEFFKKGISDNEDGIALSPDNPFGNFNLAELYLDMGDAYRDKKYYQSAVEQYSKAIASDPRYASAFFARGRAYHYLGKEQEARADFKRAGELNSYYKLKKFFS